MMLQLAFTFMLFFCSSSVYGQNVVKLSQVQLTGTTMTTRNGRNISAYLGIPYAEPPIGELRFKNPQSWNQQNQVISADTDGNECPQINDDGELVGDEDCLFLNVYSPNTSPEKSYPTMVYFHGGDYYLQGSGSSTNAGPEYLLDRDIILVTVNYSLGVLGFLSTGDAQAPGNFGLKDQVVALKWVQENISGFGGDPKKVTIFGEGAGGVATSLHAIFEPSRDLFSQYISQSGTAVSLWGIQDITTYKKRAFDLGSYLNCPTSNSQVLVDCLRNADVYDLIDSNDIFNDTEWIFRTWVPTIEPKELDGAFITMKPVDKMLQHGMKDCPAILGNVFDEGLLLTAAYYTNDTLYNSMKENLFAYLKYVISFSFEDVNPKLSAIKAQDFYFNGSLPTDRKTFTQNMTNFLSDLGFRKPMDIQIRIMDYVTQTPFYLYAFDYRGTFSKTSDTLGNNDNIGVTHGDDLIYLFPTKTSNITLNESDNKMIDIMVDFWTTFAYTGTPTSEYTSDPNVWKPYIYETPNLLQIGDNSDPTDLREYPELDIRLAFWDTQIW